NFHDVSADATSNSSSLRFIPNGGPAVTMQPSPYAVTAPMNGPQRATGKQLLNATWTMLRQDRELFWLPALGALAGLVAAVVLFVPGWFIGAAVGGTDHHSWAGAVGGLLAAVAATIVGIYCRAALVIGANVRA